MKKLFFAAFVAVVAVGGALSTQANTYIGLTTDKEYNCNGDQTICSEIIDPLDVFVYNSADPLQTPIASSTLDSERELVQP